LRQSKTPKSYRDQFATASHITKAKNLNQSVCDRRLPYDSLKSHLDQFATASYITKAENINQLVYGPQATSRKPGNLNQTDTDP
jgi:hypothetical protein